MLSALSYAICFYDADLQQSSIIIISGDKELDPMLVSSQLSRNLFWMSMESRAVGGLNTWGLSKVNDNIK